MSHKKRKSEVFQGLLGRNDEKLKGLMKRSNIRKASH